MAKAKTVFFCTNCGNETPKWMGRCPGCGAYNTMEEHIEKPGILVECGFLSNPKEDAMLKTPEYQKKLCCVIAAATDSYLSNT